MKFVQQFRDRHGKERVYYRRDGKRIALPAISSPDFLTAYQEAAAAFENASEPKTRGAPGTFARLIFEYEQSLDFKN